MSTTQVAKDNATIMNAEQINNNLYDDPLKFFFDKIVPNELKKQVEVIYYLVNKDVLKKRFAGNNFKYEELANSLISFNSSKNIDNNKYLLDDGYKSIIKSLIAVSSNFILKSDNGKNEYLVLKNKDDEEQDGIMVFIEERGMVFKYDDKKINTYEIYERTKKILENLKSELCVYLNCATQFGNFFQFNNIYIEDLNNVSFIAKEIKFKVSNDIIPNLIRPLYGEKPECGLREIIQNACDACKELNNLLCEKDASIELSIIKDNNEWYIIVRDFGIGMNEDILLKKYFVIGESSKKDSQINLVGQFGIGALAAFLLGDEINVRTKYYKQEEILEFNYILDKDSNKNIAVNKSTDEDFKCGTEVKIKLKKKYSSIEDLEKDLKINEWYIMSDIKIEYYFNNEKKKIKSFSTDEYVWNKIVDTDNIEVSYLENFYENSGQVIYNGLMVPEKYDLSSRIINRKPFLNIKCNNNSIKLNLERSKIESGQSLFVEPIRKKLIDDFNKAFKNDIRNIIDVNGDILNFTYSTKYSHEVDLLFCREGVCIYSNNNINALKSKYNKIAKCYLSYNSNKRINLNDLDDKTLYLFRYNIPGNKSILGDLIEQGVVFFAKTPFIKQYFYYANSSNTGFRKDIIKKLYKVLLNEVLEKETSNGIWNYHNLNKEEKFKEIFVKNEPIRWIDKNYSKEYSIDISNISNKFSEYLISISYIKSLYSGKFLDSETCAYMFR